MIATHTLLSAFEVSKASIIIVAALLCAVSAAGIGALVRAYILLAKKRRIFMHEVMKVEQALQQEHLSSSSELTIRRKGSEETITLPQHYTPHAADELLELLKH
jgi:hypothetical protein